MLLNGTLDTQNLLCHDGQHLQLDTVELIKARPGARRSQTFKELQIWQVCNLMLCTHKCILV